MAIFNKNKEKKKKKKVKLPRTVQQTIPYLHVYEENGIIETEEGYFTKSYFIQDINYQVSEREDQKEMFLKYCDVLNTFDSNVNVQITINNTNIDKDTFKKDVTLQYKADGLNELREEYNDMILNKMSEGKNNLNREKYITLGINADNIEAARSAFTRIDAEIIAGVKKIGQSAAIPLTTMERLEILHNIYNIGKEGYFGAKALVGKEEVTNFSFAHIKKQGLTTKDVIGPDSFQFKTDHFMMGEKYGRALFLDDLPTSLSDTLVDELSSISSNALFSINIKPVSQDKALKLVKRQIVTIDGDIISRQKEATKNGYSADLLPLDLKTSRNEAEELLDNLTNKNQKMFLMTFVIVHFADTLEDLNKTTSTLLSIARKHVCDIRKLLWQHEAGLTSALPLATNKVLITRTLTTHSAAVFMPFSTQELAQKNGIYYGINALSRNLIHYDRFSGDNQNGFIFGVSGSGKTFAAKREMLSVLLNTDDDVIVIDPEREYGGIAETLGGVVVKIAPGSKFHINPMDMDEEYAGEEGNSPISLKYSFLISLFEMIIGGNYGLTPVEKSIIDRTTRLIYQEYMVDFNPDKLPTLLKFQVLLKSQPEREAKELALALEIYTSGSLDIFAHKTNVNINSRFTVYDIKDVGTSMKNMSMLIMLDAIWNKIIENYRLGKRTWFYIDEVYLLFKNEVSANFLQEIYKRARKWDGVPTGITQNVEDVLRSETARTMLSNSSFVMMLNQAPLDRKELADLLNISSTQLGYIMNSSRGEGLIYTGRTIVPFVDKFPTDTKLYKAMTSKPGD